MGPGCGVGLWGQDVGLGYGVRLWVWDMGSGYGLRLWGKGVGSGCEVRLLLSGFGARMWAQVLGPGFGAALRLWGFLPARCAVRPRAPHRRPPPHRTGSFSGPWAPTTGTARCWRRAAAGAASPRGSGSAANSTPGRRSTRPTWVRGGPRAAGSCGANGGWKRRTAVRGGGARRCGAALGAVGQLWALWGRDAQCYGMALGAVGLGCSTLWGSTGRYGAALGTIG